MTFPHAANTLHQEGHSIPHKALEAMLPMTEHCPEVQDVQQCYDAGPVVHSEQNSTKVDTTDPVKQVFKGKDLLCHIQQKWPFAWPEANTEHYCNISGMLLMSMRYLLSGTVSTPHDDLNKP